MVRSFYPNFNCESLYSIKSLDRRSHVTSHSGYTPSKSCEWVYLIYPECNLDVDLFARITVRGRRNID